MYEDILGYLGSFDILRLYKEIVESIGIRIYLIYLNIMVYIRIHLDIMGYTQV